MAIDLNKPYWIMHKNTPVMVTVQKPCFYVATLDGEVQRFVEESEMFESKEALAESLKTA